MVAHRTMRIRRCEGGIALLSALVLMVAVLMTGIASTRAAIQSARAAGHERDRVLAVQMAHAGLRDAERDIEGGAAPGSARAAAFASASPAAFAADCRGGAPYDGMCTQQAGADGVSTVLAEDDGPAVLFGRFTGSRLAEGGGLPQQAPRYLIELLAPVDTDLLYRITARGAGALPGTHAALQGYYRKPADGSPGRRVGWRELGNWSAWYLSQDEP